MTQKNLNRIAETFESIETTVREKKRPRNNWEEIVFPNFVPPWTESVAHYTIDYTDSPPKEISGKAGEAMPTLDYESRKDNSAIRDFGFWLDFDLKDERAALQGDSNPMQIKTNLAFARERKAIFDTIINGGGISGLTGIANASTGDEPGDIPLTAITAGGAWTASGKTAQNILDDLNAMYDTTADNTEGVAPANTMWLPLQAIQRARTARLPNAPLNVLETFRQSVQEATGQAFLVRQNQAFGKDVVMGRWDEESARINISQSLRFGPMQAEGWGYRIPCHYAHSGIEFLDSYSFTKMRNVVA